MSRDAAMHRKAWTVPPTFEERHGFVIVTFKAPIVPGAGAGSEKSREKTPEKTPEKILRLLRENPAMSLTEVAARIGKSRRAVERASVKLAKTGCLKRIGPDKGGHWEVTR